MLVMLGTREPFFSLGIPLSRPLFLVGAATATIKRKEHVRVRRRGARSSPPAPSFLPQSGKGRKVRGASAQRDRVHFPTKKEGSAQEQKPLSILYICRPGQGCKRS